MDEVFKSKIHYQEHTGELTHELTQPSEDVILSRNADLRKNEHAMHDLGAQGNDGVWGRHLCTIPLNVFEKAKREGFDLECKDKDIAEKELFRFLKTPEGQICLTGQRG